MELRDEEAQRAEVAPWKAGRAGRLGLRGEEAHVMGDVGGARRAQQVQFLSSLRYQAAFQEDLVHPAGDLKPSATNL
jgi:hypothetical protein